MNSCHRSYTSHPSAAAIEAYKRQFTACADELCDKFELPKDSQINQARAREYLGDLGIATSARVISLFRDQNTNNYDAALSIAREHGLGTDDLEKRFDNGDSVAFYHSDLNLVFY